MQLNKKVSTDILVNAGVAAAIQLRGLIFIPVIAGTLGVAAFGAYSQVLAVMTFLDLIVSLGLFTALVRYGQESGQDIADLYYSLVLLAMGSGAVATSLVIVFAPELSRYTLGTLKYANVYRVGSVLILTRIFLRMARDYFRIDSRIKTFSMIEGINAYGLIIGVAIALFVFDAGLIGIIYSMVLVESVTAVSTQFKIGREIGYAAPSFDRIVEYLRYSLPLTGSMIAGNASSRVDRVLIGAFLGASAVGVYSIAYQIATAISMYKKPILSTFFPEFSRLIELDQYEECSHYVEQGTRYFSLIALPTVGGMFLIGPQVITAMTGSEAATPSGLLLATIALGIVVYGFDQMYALILRANKQTVRVTGIRGVGAIGNVLLNLALIPTFGVFGAAIATLGTYALTALLAYYSANAVVDAKFATLTSLRTVVSTIFMIVLARTYLPDSVAILVVSGVIIYFLAIVLMGEVSIAEVRRVVESFT